ncbi:hypothetical protein ACF08M_24105 [Streptomyces sp. NPDC015032]|uniref:hypothetical protein n=1 Tax=Streptomyces sp. NPDC015032 TaxID=3364937 RepID=UPI0036FD7CB1
MNAPSQPTAGGAGRDAGVAPAPDGAAAVLGVLAEAAAAVDPGRPAMTLGIAAAGVVDP